MALFDPNFETEPVAAMSAEGPSALTLLQACFGFFNLQTGFPKVGVVLQCFADEALQLRIFVELTPLLQGNGLCGVGEKLLSYHAVTHNLLWAVVGVYLFP